MSQREPPAIGPPVVLDDAAISTRGIEELRPIVVSPQESPNNRYVISAGPPRYDAPVVLTLDHLRLRSAEGDEILSGPWSFSVSLDQLPVDPVSNVVSLNESVERDDISVTVSDVHVSSTEVLVSYSLSTDRDLADAFSPLIELPDGTVFGGSQIGTAREDPTAQIGDQMVSFPSLPDDITEFHIRVGPFLEPTSGGDIVISLPEQPITSDPGSHQVDSHVESDVGDETLLADEITVFDERFRIRLRANPASAEQITLLGTTDVTIRDDLNNEYTLLDYAVGYGQTSDHTIFFREVMINAEGMINSEASYLVVQVSEFARLQPGPWKFHVDVTAGN